LGHVLPLAVFLLVGTLEPKPPVAGQAEGVSLLGLVRLPIAYDDYPLVYTVKIALTSAAVAVVWPVYRAFGGRPGALAAVVGLAGGAVWIALCAWGLEARLGAALELDWLVQAGQRSAYNPLERLAHAPAWAYGFLAIRLVGLVVVLPLAEELFLRGFLMRFVSDPDWTRLTLGQISPLGLAAGTLIPVLMHPAEAVAAAVWFSAVTWLMLRRQCFWDCVVAHALTNLVLGIWALATGQWQLL
jgi:hypothetical protein